MSVIEVKKVTKLNLTPDKEIDLRELLNALYAAKKAILSGVVISALLGMAVTFLLPQQWSSQAVIIPAETQQWQQIQQQLVKLQVLDIDTKITRGSVFTLFIKKFQSRSLLEEFLASSPLSLADLNDAGISPDELHRRVVNMAEKMKSASNHSNVREGITPWSSWTLSFVAGTAQDAQAILQGYIDYIAAVVKKETMQKMRNAVNVKILLEEGRLEYKRVYLENLRRANIQRLNYSLEIANAAGIKKPVYSSGEAVIDDPDYSVVLGADGIERKLAIEKSITDVAKLDVDFKNQQHQLELLRQVVIQDVHFEPFKYQLSPSLPVTEDSLSKGIVVLLFTGLGGFLTCASIVLRRAMMSHRARTE